MSGAEGRLEVAIEDGTPPVVVLKGEVDPHTAPELEELLGRLIDEGHREIHFECRSLAFIDSSGLRVLVDAHRRLGTETGAMVLRNPSPTLRRLLEVTGLDEHFAVEPADAS
jgi:anti-sigma B factor antagonist